MAVVQETARMTWHGNDKAVPNLFSKMA